MKAQAQTSDDSPLLPGQAPYPRVVRLGPLEWIGIPLLALLPLLALSGVLGPSKATLATGVSTGVGDVSMALSYPTRLRHGTDSALEVTVSNTSGETLPPLSLGVDQAYLQHFGRVQVLPPPHSLTGGAMRIGLPALAAGDSASIRLLIEAGDWGRLPGWVELRGEHGAALARLSFRTLVLP